MCLDHHQQDDNARVATLQQDTGRPRIRVRKACGTCKRRKVKCNGQQPCAGCAKHGSVCHYKVEPVTRPASAALKAGAPGPAGTLPALSQVPAPSDFATGPAPASPWQRFSPGKYRFHRRHQNLVPYYLGQALISSLPPALVQKYALRAPRLQFYGWNMSGGHYLKQGSTFGAPQGTAWRWDLAVELQRQILEKCASFFFQHVNRFVSIVHEQAFWQQFRGGFLDGSDGKNGSSDLFEAILNLIAAIALRFSYSGAGASVCEALTAAEVTWLDLHLTRHGRHLEETLFERAYAVTTRLSFEWESFELIQAWLLAAVYLRTCHRQVSCWQALSRAVQMCNGMSLYLNRFPEKHTAYDECRARNCYWACFVLDRLISFQMGRFPELAGPGPDMGSPDTVADTWFSAESVALYKLAAIVTTCQRRYGQELTAAETQKLGARLDEWHGDCEEVLADPDLCARQVLLTYLDVRIALEIRGLFQLLDVGSDTVRYALPLDAVTLVDLASRVLDQFEAIVESGLFFRPWWLNLSLLFTCSVICLTLVQGGLQLARAQALLSRSFHIWHFIEGARPPNPPGMARECLWCLKMLNHMFCQRLTTSAEQLESIIGVDPGDDSVNQNKFRQFGKVDMNRANDDDAALLQSESDTISPADDSNNLVAHLQWFDQWLDVDNLQTMF